MTTGSWIALTGFAVPMAGRALAQVPASPVIDGDTLRCNGTAVHLWGIGAPEKAARPAPTAGRRAGWQPTIWQVLSTTAASPAT